MREIADMMRLVLPFAPGCPEPVAVQYLREAAITFCERTRIWRASDKFNVQGGCDEVLCTPSYAQIYEIERAWFNDRDLEPAPYGGFDRHEYRDALPRYITQASPESVRLVPGALEEGVLTLSLFLKPSQDAEDLPDILTEHERVIADGALNRILLIPNQPFTSPDMAAAYGQSFQSGLDRLFNLNVRGKQRAPVRIRGRYF